jgi:hypothetical protein
LVPRSHLAPGHFLGPLVFPNRAKTNPFKNSPRTLFEFHLPPECFLASPSRPHRRDDTPDNSPGLSFPSAHPRLGGPLAAGLPHPLRSAFRVWLPSWRFPPPGPAPALFRADSAPGISPSGAFPSRKVSRPFPPGKDPHVVSPAVAPLGDPSGRTGRPRLLGFDPSESPLLRVALLTLTQPDAPLGFGPFQGKPPNALPTLPRGFLSHAWQLAAALTAAAPAPQSLDRRPAHPTFPPGPARRQGGAARLGFLHRSVLLFEPVSARARGSPRG